MMALVLAIAAAMIAGVSMATQGVFNAVVARSVGAFPTALISMSVAALTLSIAIALLSMPSRGVLVSLAPYPLMVGGFLGAIVLSSVLFAIQRIGSASTVAFFILGQVIASIAIDHAGFLGITQQPVTTTRVLGAGAVLLGALMVVKG